MTELTPVEVDALQAALDDEYHALATYDQVVCDFGEVRPFINIRESEARHIVALQRLFERYGLPVPANAWPGRVKRYRRLSDACADAVDAESANAGLYERLMASTARDDLRAVFGNLREASQARHLPAFQRCLGVGRRGRHASALFS
jgi:hypothetical protein